MSSAVSPPTDQGSDPAAAPDAAAVALTADESRGFVDLPHNPPPANAEVIWYEARGRKVRMLFAAEPKGGVKTRGTVFICPGRTEFIEKYFEAARELQARGFALAIFDWPGQGLSQRLLKDPMKGHVRVFSQYVEALKRGVAKLGRKAPRPHMILAHSMGGTIALEAMRTRAVEVEAAAFSSPMWGLPVWFGQRWLARLVRMFGFGAMYARAPMVETAETSRLTHDEVRWRLYHDLTTAEPRLALGEPTLAWVVAALNVFRALQMPAALDHLRRTPMLVAMADKELLVSNRATKRVAKRLKEAKIMTIQGAKHELLMEIDERREKFWKAFDEMCKRTKI